jgi:NTP pyrophosphatase (non-canonical NTP hydrolase)
MGWTIGVAIFALPLWSKTSVISGCGETTPRGLKAFHGTSAMHGGYLRSALVAKRNISDTSTVLMTQRERMQKPAYVFTKNLEELSQTTGAHEMTYTVLKQAVADLQASCHGASKQAGWWTDLKTGKPIDPNTRFVEKLALIHSEISEALEGFRKNLKDDKLPHRDMAEVELADALIRIFDLAGAMGYDIGGALVEKMAYNARREDHKPEVRKATHGKAF